MVWKRIIFSAIIFLILFFIFLLPIFPCRWQAWRSYEGGISPQWSFCSPLSIFTYDASPRFFGFSTLNGLIAILISFILITSIILFAFNYIYTKKAQ